MNILVIGGTRFFGIPMVNALLRRNHGVTVATRGNKDADFCKNVERLRLDKTSAESVKNALSSKRFDLVIDKVAYSSNDVRTLFENASFDKYIQMSTCSVYENPHLDTKEEEFVAKDYPLRWIDRTTDYQESKRQAERAAVEFGIPSAFVRYPIVLGENDYTERLKFYLDHIKSGRPMFVDDMDKAIPFIHEKEAGEFIAHLAEHFEEGAVNGASDGTVRIRDIIDHAQNVTKKKALLADDGDFAPFNGLKKDVSYSTQKAESLGFSFAPLKSYIFSLIDFYNDI